MCDLFPWIVRGTPDLVSILPDLALFSLLAVLDLSSKNSMYQVLQFLLASFGDVFVSSMSNPVHFSPPENKLESVDELAGIFPALPNLEVLRLHGAYVGDAYSCYQTGHLVSTYKSLHPLSLHRV
jgi:hypothetical protein